MGDQKSFKTDCPINSHKCYSKMHEQGHHGLEYCWTDPKSTRAIIDAQKVFIKEYHKTQRIALTSHLLL